MRAAILLDRLKFSPGEISSRYDENLAKAIAAFQSASGLRALGLVDSPTWAALNFDQAQGHIEQIKTESGQKPPGDQQQKPPVQPAPPASTAQGVPAQAVVAYTIAKGDVAGPFTRRVMILASD